MSREGRWVNTIKMEGRRNEEGRKMVKYTVKMAGRRNEEERKMG
jgi:hypothetical protein